MYIFLQFKIPKFKLKVVNYQFVIENKFLLSWLYKVYIFHIHLQKYG